FRGALPVRKARGVAEVDEVLVGERDEQLVQDGQPTDARVEHADRPIAWGGGHGSSCWQGAAGLGAWGGGRRAAGRARVTAMDFGRRAPAGHRGGLAAAPPKRLAQLPVFASATLLIASLSRSTIVFARFQWPWVMPTTIDAM